MARYREREARGYAEGPYRNIKASSRNICGHKHALRAGFEAVQGSQALALLHASVQGVHRQLQDAQDGCQPPHLQNSALLAARQVSTYRRAPAQHSTPGEYMVYGTPASHAR